MITYTIRLLIKIGFVSFFIFNNGILRLKEKKMIMIIIIIIIIIIKMLFISQFIPSFFNIGSLNFRFNSSSDSRFFFNSVSNLSIFSILNLAILHFLLDSLILILFLLVLFLLFISIIFSSSNPFFIVSFTFILFM